MNNNIYFFRKLVEKLFLAKARRTFGSRSQRSQSRYLNSLSKTLVFSDITGISRDRRINSNNTLAFFASLRLCEIYSTVSRASARENLNLLGGKL